MTDREIETKLRRLSKSLLPVGQMDQALNLLWRLEDVKSADEIFRLFEFK